MFNHEGDKEYIQKWNETYGGEGEYVFKYFFQKKFDPCVKK